MMKRLPAGLWIALALSLLGVGCGRVTPPTPAVVVARPSTTATRPEPVEAPQPDSLVERIERAGVRIEASIATIRPGEGGVAVPPREGDDVRVRVRVSDANGRPIPGARPAAWLVPGEEAGPLKAPALNRRVASLVRGDRLAPPEIDFNQYHVAALNDDATITVVDPLSGFGGTKLLALVELPGVGEDWALSPDGRRFYVSIPSADRVIAVDAASWVVAAEAAEIPGASRLALQGDGHYLWVGRAGGVSVVEAATMKVVGRFETGPGPHSIALDPEDRRAYVADAGAGTLTVVDVGRLTRVGELAVGGEPIAIAYSSAGHAAYAVEGRGGSVAIVGGDPPALIGRVEVGDGPRSIAFAPGGRLAFVTHPDRDEVSVIDASVNRLARTVDVDGAPDQVVFTDRVAYIRAADSAMVRAMPLDGAETRGRAAMVVDVPAGQHPLGRSEGSAPAIARAPAEGAVLIANPADRAIYYYQEGMSAPSGSFRNASHAPRSVMTIDRSLRASGPGVFETVARLRSPGAFDLILLLDNPRIVHAFRVQVEADPSRPPVPMAVEVVSEPVPDAEAPRPGKAGKVRFRVRGSEGGQPVAGRADVRVLAVLHGRWQRSGRAEPGPEPGLYLFEFTPPEPGMYHFFVEVPATRPSNRNPWAFSRKVSPTP
jgi:YVTN family beta-propeller protein